MIEIKFGSRYYEVLGRLKSRINLNRLFNEGYNEDKEYYYTIFDSVKNPNESYVITSERFLDDIVDFLDRELYSVDEKKLLIGNLLVYMQIFGNATIESVVHQDKVVMEIATKRELNNWGAITAPIIIDELNIIPIKLKIIIEYVLNIKRTLTGLLEIYYNSLKINYVIDKGNEQVIIENESKTLSLIKEHISGIDDKAWQYSFHNENDFNAFTGLLTTYFEQREYKLPVEVIKLKRGSKTKLAKALGEILRVLGNKNKMNGETEYFDIVRKLSHFENEKDIYKAITR